jgi:UDP-glucose 4-epimerase
MQVLVTGGAGYVGSVVSAQLIAAGHDVTVLDNFARGHRDAVPPGIALCDVDLGNADAVTAVLANGAFDAVVHLAALSLVGESVAEPARYFRGNIGAALNLLDAMRSAGVARIVFSSTAAVYGQPDEVPITETATPRPTTRTARPSWPSISCSASRPPRTAWPR